MDIINCLIQMQIPPAVILIIGALLLFLSPKEIIQRTLVVVVPIMALVYIWIIPTTKTDILHQPLSFSFAGFGQLYPLYIHKFSHIFATGFLFITFVGGIFALHHRNYKELAVAFMYVGGATGVLFSGDLIMLFIFWIMMAIASIGVLFFSNSKTIESVGRRYTLIQLLGGSIFLIGIIAHIESGGTQMITGFVLQEAAFNTWSVESLASWIILSGVLISAATPPFSSWLTDALSEGSLTAVVFLSVLTTMTSVFLLMILFSGNDILLYIGLFMIFYGIFYAVLENNIRKILAFSIISHVGFMIVGIGIGSKLALNGVATYVLCFIILKTLLVMSACSVIYMTGKYKCSELGGLFRSMRVTTICTLVGALGISAFPFTSGFISQSMVVAAAHSERFQIIWYALLVATVGGVLHAGMKFPWFVFFRRDSHIRPKDPPLNMRIAMIACAFISLILGAFPQLIYMILPDMVDYNAYAHNRIITQLQLLIFAGLAFLLMLPAMKPTATISLDFDWFFRVMGLYFLRLIDRIIFCIKDMVVSRICCFFRFLMEWNHNLHRPSNDFINTTRPVVMPAIWVLIIVLIYSIIHYIANHYGALLIFIKQERGI